MITIEAGKLANLLTDLLDTADETRGIHLATHRAAIGDEPGETDVLAGLSSTGFVLGHTWAECIGQGESTVWTVDAAAIVVSICKTLAAKGSKEQQVTVDILTSVAPPPDGELKDGELPEWAVTVRETPALFDSDTVFEFHAQHANTFPVETFRRVFTDDMELSDPSWRDLMLSVWNPHVLAPLLKIAKRHSTPRHVEAIRLYRKEDRAVQRVEIGDSWIGAVMPIKPVDRSDLPGIDALLPNQVNA